jgi:hypothetical protein
MRLLPGLSAALRRLSVGHACAVACAVALTAPVLGAGSVDVSGRAVVACCLLAWLAADHHEFQPGGAGPVGHGSKAKGGGQFGAGQVSVQAVWAPFVML